ncbi:uncharacterized protein [Littorina saxatilis]|uniref:uncharacterized protein n=1 Tax=Littorina saxatilis TaxID=31220 RepID=UPI0038B65E79
MKPPQPRPSPLTPPLGLGVPLLLLLTSLPRGVTSTCRFPDFLQRDAPWAASYGLDARLVMYVKGTYMSVSQQADHRDTKYTRKCERRAPDNKFLVTHQEERQEPRYLCMQFLQRSENIVQMKVSSLSPRQSLELCDERMMAIDRWPIVQMSQTPEQKIPCPFLGGYNVNLFYPNDTALCTDSTLLMRIESECEAGEGIVFDFRQDDCVPVSLPRSTKQQAYCIAHWTQGSQTFVIVQHAEIHKQTWCLRISDPLSDIHSAHLMLDLVCDTGDVIRDTRNFFRMTLSRRVYASTCEDEIENDVCQDMKHLCKTDFKRHCARTCGTCRSENEMGDCAFQESYRGMWVESAVQGDKQLKVGAYSLSMEPLGRYDCLRLEDSHTHKDKRVLVRIDDNGCYPRYACVEMEKISSSAMRFRLGDRHQWPLHQARDRKDHLCAAKNFLSRNAIESRFHVQRPPRLLVKESNINRVLCGLPRRLQNGIAFREEGQSCSGCLMFRPSVSRDRFVVRPHNCSSGGHSAGQPPQRQTTMTTIEYSCLAAFTFHNNSHAVVTKTNTYDSWGQYLCWVFTPDNYIKTPVLSNTKTPVLSNTKKSVLTNTKKSVLTNTKKSVLTNTKKSVLTNTKTPVLSNTKTPVLSNTKTPVLSNTKTPVLTNTKTPVLTNTKTRVLTNTKTPVLTNTKTPVLTNTKTPVLSNTKTRVLTNTKTPVLSNTKTPVLSNTKTPVLSNTKTPVLSNTKTPVLTNTKTPVLTNTKTPVLSNTKTPVLSNTKTPVLSNTKTPVLSNTKTPVLTSTKTAQTHAVIKAAETFLFEEEEGPKAEQLQAQFSIIRDAANSHCHNVIAIATPPNRPDVTTRMPTWPLTSRPPRGQGERPDGATYRPVVYEVQTKGRDSQGKLPPTHGVGQTLEVGQDTSSARSALCRTSGFKVTLTLLALLVVCGSWR